MVTTLPPPINIAMARLRPSPPEQERIVERIVSRCRLLGIITGRVLLRLREAWRQSKANTLRTLVYIAIAIMVVGLTVQRSYYPHPHWTFWIFRASFWHLLRGQDLYAHYGSHDLFKYSPTAALLFAPFAWPSFAAGLLLWNTLNAATLVAAIRKFVRPADESFALLLVLPELFHALQASQSNAFVTALVLAAFLAFEQGHQLRAAVSIALSVAIKIFPIAAVSFVLFHPRRARATVLLALSATLLLLVPLTVTSPSMLATQYVWWRDVEISDAVARGASVMRMLKQGLGVTWPNWPVQLAGTAVLLLPLVRRERWTSRRFRLTYLSSLLVFMVIFNHQAERPSFVIAATGVAIWFMNSQRDRVRLALVLFSLTGLLAWAYAPVWIYMQCELLGVLKSQPELLTSSPTVCPAVDSFAV